eukprot:351335-Chlamydomonas_euryale.AAC.5
MVATHPTPGCAISWNAGGSLVPSTLAAQEGGGGVRMRARRGGVGLGCCVKEAGSAAEVRDGSGLCRSGGMVPGARSACLLARVMAEVWGRRGRRALRTWGLEPHTWPATCAVMCHLVNSGQVLARNWHGVGDELRQ